MILENIVGIYFNLFVGVDFDLYVFVKYSMITAVTCV